MAGSGTINGTVLCLAGKIASGKTTISTRVAAAMGCSRVAFGDRVRAEARARGLPDNRHVLQELGEELIDQLGWREFCRGVLSQVVWPLGMTLVVDGVRHAEALDTLQDLVVPARVLLVYLQADDDVRAARQDSRRRTGDDHRDAVEAHRTEVQQGRLLQRADLVLDGSEPEREIVEAIVERITNGAAREP